MDTRAMSSRNLNARKMLERLKKYKGTSIVCDLWLNKDYAMQMGPKQARIIKSNLTNLTAKIQILGSFWSYYLI